MINDSVKNELMKKYLQTLEGSIGIGVAMEGPLSIFLSRKFNNFNIVNDDKIYHNDIKEFASIQSIPVSEIGEEPFPKIDNLLETAKVDIEEQIKNSQINLDEYFFKISVYPADNAIKNIASKGFVFLVQAIKKEGK